jgi:hypothetical protein
MKIVFTEMKKKEPELLCMEIIASAIRSMQRSPDYLQLVSDYSYSLGKVRVLSEKK